MRVLHPVTWVVVVLVLVSIGWAGTNWLLLAAVVAGLVALTLAEGSATLLGIAGLAGLAVLALQLANAVLLGTANGRVLFTVPQWRLGLGVRLGGDVDAAMVLGGAVTGGQAALVLVALAVLAGVRPARDWLDLGQLVLGRGVEWIAPVVGLGEAGLLVRRDAQRLADEGLGRLGVRRGVAAVGTRAVRLSDDWRRRTPRPARFPGLAAACALLGAIAVLWVFGHGSLFIGPVELLPGQVAALAVLVWTVLRWIVVRTVGVGCALPGLGWRDGLVFGGAVLALGTLEWARRSGEAVALADSSLWPALPLWVMAAVLLLVILTGSCAASGRQARA